MNSLGKFTRLPFTRSFSQLSTFLGPSLRFASRMEYISTGEESNSYLVKKDGWDHYVTCIEPFYVSEGVMSPYLLFSKHQGGSEPPRAAFLDVNANNAVPHLLAALEANGLEKGDVKYVLPTHAHLDHAGGVGSLAEQIPTAEVLAHPRAARHLREPARLEAGSRAVYGDEQFDKLYGKLVPCPQTQDVEDGKVIELAPGRPLHFMHLRGHAKHHYAVHDPATSTVFSGDCFGILYQRFSALQPPFIYCSSSPVDFEPQEALTAVDRIVQTGCERVAVAHFGVVKKDVAGAGEILKGSIGKHGELMQKAMQLLTEGKEPAAVEGQIFEELRAFFLSEMEARGLVGAEREALFKKWVIDDVKINASGIVTAAQRDTKAKL